MSTRDRYVPRAIRGNVYGGLGVGDILDKPRARVYRNAGLSVNSATATTITFDAFRYDPDGMWSSTTNPSRITCRTAGVYQFVYNQSFVFDANGNRGIWFNVTSGATTWIEGEVMGYPTATSGTWYGTTTSQITLNAGDYVECVCWQASGGAIAIVASDLPTTSPGNRTGCEVMACLISTI